MVIPAFRQTRYRDFGFHVNFRLLSSDVPRLSSYGVYISQFVRLARCCTCVSDFYSKSLQITSNILTWRYRYYKLRFLVCLVLNAVSAT